MERVQALALIAVTAITMVAALSWLEDRGLRRLTGDRPNLSEDELYEKFYAHAGISKDFFSKTWRAISAMLKISPGQLRPDDRLNSLLGVPAWLGSDGFTRVEQMIAEVDSRVPKTVDHPDEFDTIDDVVRFLWKAKVDLSSAP